ncbi:hypothetical protein [Desulfovibrio cuneatus]|uniref:hypothetical protein n=1 Tax=Desulfovibrio cuneatus TaxID=159728 RepID=UPI000426C148|nr:hypothetical protein [Desulfovibrio cuneatus]
MTELEQKTQEQQEIIVPGLAKLLADDWQQELESRHGELVALLATLTASLLPQGWRKASPAQRAAFLDEHRAGVKRILAPMFEGIVPAAEKAVEQLHGFMGNHYGITPPAPFSGSTWAKSTLIAEHSPQEWAAKQADTVSERIVRASRSRLDEDTLPRNSKLVKDAIAASEEGINLMAQAFIVSGVDAARQSLFPGFAWKYRAKMDGYTCGTCEATHGQIFQDNQPRPSLPRHPRCRCAYVPVPVV